MPKKKCLVLETHPLAVSPRYSLFVLMWRKANNNQSIDPLAVYLDLMNNSITWTLASVKSIRIASSSLKINRYCYIILKSFWYLKHAMYQIPIKMVSWKTITDSLSVILWNSICVPDFTNGKPTYRVYTFLYLVKENNKNSDFFFYINI